MDSLTSARTTLENLPPPENDLQYVIFALAAAITAIWLGTTFIQAKYGKGSEPPPPPPPTEPKEGSKELCAIHTHRVDALQAQLSSVLSDLNQSMQKIRADMNNSTLENERAFHQFFKEMMKELEDRMDKRDERLETLMDGKLASFKEVFVRTAAETFRPMVQEAVSQAMRSYQKPPTT